MSIANISSLAGLALLRTALVLILAALLPPVLAEPTSSQAPASGTGDHEQLPPWVDNSLGMRLMLVPSGSFLRGSPPGEPGRLKNEGPQRKIVISRPFYLGAHEVTVEQFDAFSRATGYRSDAERDVEGGFGIDFETGRVQQDASITWRQPGFPGFEPTREHPVILVSWQDAERFCTWLSEKEGRTYRLPTEAEWEYAARAGGTGRYAFGDDSRELQQYANVADVALKTAVPAAPETEPWDDGFPFLAPVGSFLPNALGLFDMHGNVWEWCADWYQHDAYDAADGSDPQGPPLGRFRSIRGGGWFNGADQNRAAQRVYFDPTFRYCLLSGFRVVLEAAPP